MTSLTGLETKEIHLLTVQDLHLITPLETWQVNSKFAIVRQNLETYYKAVLLLAKRNIMY